MLSLGLLFFSLVEIMVLRVPPAVVGGNKAALGGRRRLSPGTRDPAMAGEGRARMRRNRPGKLRPGERGVPAASPAHWVPVKQSAAGTPTLRMGSGEEGGAGLA